MSQVKKEQLLDAEYDKIKKYKYKNNAQILFNIIYAKEYFQMRDYKNSLYFDAKRFIKNYIMAADDLDFGYDELRVNKIISICNKLELKEQISLLSYTRRYFYIKGYNQDEISKKITQLECRIAFKDCQYLKGLRLLASYNLGVLLLTYLIYVIIILLVLLPAPFPFMEIFEVRLKDYSTTPLYNYPLNALAILTGNESLSPEIIPLGFIGLVIYCIGVILFYFFIVNYVFKRLEDFITLK